MNYKKIKTMQHVHNALKIDSHALPDFSMIPPAEAKDQLNNLYFKRMIRAINMDDEGNEWEPYWYDLNQEKIQPYFIVSASKEQPGGFAFSYSDYDSGNAFTGVGSRLCFRDSDRFYHAFKHFKDLFIENYLILK